jgi:hypothetical protein
LPFLALGNCSWSPLPSNKSVKADLSLFLSNCSFVSIWVCIAIDGLGDDYHFGC